MRHRHSRLRLRHKPAHSRALVRNLLTSLLLYETVRTTKKRAEVVRPQVESLISIAKSDVPRNAIRRINAVVTHRNASKKLIEVLKDRYATRSSGFTRMVPLGARRGDGAAMVEVSLVDGVAGGETLQKAPAKEKKVSAKKSKSSSSDSSK